MNTRIIIAAAAIAVVLITGVVSAYTLTFGATPTDTQTLWGAFGDYFGGLLNPLFAMLAFLALLWSITLQKEEFHRAAGHLATQSELARKQLEDLTNDRLSQELLHVIKDIDLRLGQLLQTEVSSPNSDPIVTVALMVAESERLAMSAGESASYTHFVQLAQSQGSVVEALIREIAQLVAEMRGFLEQLSRFHTGSYAPVVVYYANKVYRLLHMLEDVGCVPADSRQFFATVSDQHH